MCFYDGQIGRPQPVNYEFLGAETLNFADSVWEESDDTGVALLELRQRAGTISGIVFHDVHTAKDLPVAVSWLDENVRRALYVRN